jgi:GT2 family glycosyltransferase
MEEIQRVAVIILNWQGATDTLACLESLLALDYPNKTLIVCDNDSQDDSIQQISAWAAAHFPESTRATHLNLPYELSDAPLDFVLLKTPRNLGFAGGMNVAMRYVQACSSYQAVWLLNNDTQIVPNALTALVHCANRRPEVGLWGSTLLELDAPEQVQAAGGCRYQPYLTRMQSVGKGESLAKVMEYPEDLRLDYISGAALFIPTRVLYKVGFLNEEYFLFYEELDYTQRLKQAGLQIAWCKASWVYHQGSATVGNVKAGNKSKLQRANYYENLSTLKYSANFYPRSLWLIAIIRFSLKAAAVCARGDFFLLKPLWQAYRDFWRGFKDV